VTVRVMVSKDGNAVGLTSIEGTLLSSVYVCVCVCACVRACVCVEAEFINVCFWFMPMKLRSLPPGPHRNQQLDAVCNVT